ncbi:c-type cytochrome [Polynucleobacter antarcticus]|uniref:Cytochrome C oxidase Cbb3 n=1 Tax=Polynucleobacter antarcticus TaxID=1743162 RepID=A0A6M9Q2C6_9BURK|nr:cytochrome c [Polynucleobacter antarcticus]QKM62443.1 cytochrome C oxidase Cbb3 [Polynucleobacter antarcticus]
MSSKNINKNQQRERELSEPDEKVKPLPWFFLMFLGAVAMWGSFYIVSSPSGGASSNGDNRAISKPQESIAMTPSADGQAIFTGKCAACHQASGLGVSGVFPPLAGAEWVLGDPKILSNILLHGVVGELKVKDVIYKGAMPAFKTLSDDEIAAVLTFIRSQWGNSASPIPTDVVKAQRELTKDREASYNGGDELIK